MKIKSFSSSFILTVALFSHAIAWSQVSHTHYEKAVGLSYTEGSTALMFTAETEEGIIQSEPKQKKPSKPDNSKSPSRTSAEKSDSKISALESKISELEKKISSIKSELKSISDIDALENKVSELEQKVSRISSSKSWFDGITFQIDIFSIFISFILSLFLFLILKSSKDTTQSTNGSIKPQSELQNYSQEIAQQQNELQRQNQKIAEYGQTISQLQDKIQQLESKLQEVQHSSPQIVVPVQTPLYASSVSPAPEPAQSSQLHQEEVFYLSTPNSDGSFNRSSASSEYREGASVYRFMKTSYNRATFQVDEREGAIKLALGYHYRAIEPVCEAENAFSRDARSIKTISQGEAELQGEKWVVTRKARIRYEY